MDIEIKKGVITTATTVVDVLTGIYTGLPLASFLANIGGVYTAHNEEIFFEKVEQFFKQTNEVPDEIKQHFKLALANDFDDFMKKIWVTIVRINELEKATILGRLLRALLEEKIKVIEYLELMDIMQRVYIGHINYFLVEGSGQSHTSYHTYFYTAKQLSAAGLMYEVSVIDGGDVSASGPVSSRFEVTPIGKILRPYGI